ncbi:MAG: argininosuccinate lyase [Maribacter dokdonensis]|uniref:Argininosuccinate lyase n=3 Tax=Maribacter dokdonensis TaxID=320912 RepID=A0A1H4K3C8_9FLAO|nr:MULTISPECIES: argininosuccinate lyase [Maribacter]HAF78422.1 argininosuccinate lyase [Maribacter sp.]KSA13302.1 Argininosuccinate lyase [Maribacter dokdonensis DSW-8]CAG2534174.1 argininosuccinate lyase [Maribacter dokdonensis]SDT45577.1 argininosuccinate lyase [Maribacter dokdonensis]SEB52402.1 argininosuccinate lyase [Maribacter dokdonensis]|tara:strand:- start:475 stop:1755 length:1281 start_codon:yes stop_codon:yes gene_type:complete
MKLWDKGFSTDKKIDHFTVGNDRELDLHLAKYDVIASKAHAKMLGKIGLISPKETAELVKELDNIAARIEKGTFSIENSFEDMHSKIEYMLTLSLGDTGKKIHTARSRNDQVLVAMHLYLKDELTEIKAMTKSLFNLLLVKAQEHKDVMLPGYTHLQIAMPSSFGLWFSAYAESLIDDLYFIEAAYKVADQNPLGSAAGYGSSFAIDRSFTTKEMGFETMKYNVVAAQMSRGKAEKATAFGIANIAATLSKMAMDICLYMSQNFDFISFPDELTTGSSIMPHKKNPDVFELVRGKCNKLQSIPNQLTLVINNLPSGYHRDLQLVKEIIVPAIQDMKACLEILTFSLKEIRVNDSILDDPKYDYLFSVDTLNELVQSGMPFRDAYKKMGMEINAGTFTPKRDIHHTHEGSLGNLCLKEIHDKMKKLN